MRIFTKAILFISFLTLVILTNCREKEFEDHYNRPGSLAQPIYLQLQAKGNFKSLLACIDKAGYKKTLSAAGYFTLFAPNDDAFEVFFADKKINGINDIDSITAQKIVRYALVYNAFRKEHLADYQSATGWVPLSAYKRRTAYYTGIYKDTITGPVESAIGGLDQPVKNLAVNLVSTNRNGSYYYDDNGNKHLPYFLSEYLTAQKLTAFDYNYFFPNIPFSGFNVADASVVNYDIEAENGIIHEIDKVILPLQSLDEYWHHKSEYSVFKGLLDNYATVYVTDPILTNLFHISTGSADPVYIKFNFFNALTFSPNNENFLKQADNDAQMDGWTLFAPTNTATTKYINEVLFTAPGKVAKRYSSLNLMPRSIIYDFINAHLWQTTVWPSKFNKAYNSLGEPARFDAANDMSEAKMLSNGIFYGTKKAQDSDVFRSVFGAAYLDPNYTLMTRFLQRELKSTIVNPNLNFTILLISDKILGEAGYSYDLSTNQWRYRAPDPGSTTPPLGPAAGNLDRWTRLINMHVAITRNHELDDLSQSGVAKTMGGELIKFNAQTIYGGGNGALDNTGPLKIPTVIDKVKAYNGTVYYLDKIIQFPEQNIGRYIEALGTAGKPYKRFFDYLSAATFYDNSVAPPSTTRGSISGILSGSFNTFFIPTDAAIGKAIDEGALPASPTTTVELDKQKIVTFISYHIIPKFTIVNDGEEDGITLNTFYKTINGDATMLKITSKPRGDFKVTDQKGNTQDILPLGPDWNGLSNRTVLYQVNNYLKF